MKVKTHHLKLDEQFCDETFSTTNKRVEIRLNDRDFQRGDLITYQTSFGKCHVEILHVLSGWGLKKGYVALSIKLISEKIYHQLSKF